MFVHLVSTMRYMLLQAMTHMIYLRYNVYDNCVNDGNGVNFPNIYLSALDVVENCLAVMLHILPCNSSKMELLIFF